MNYVEFASTPATNLSGLPARARNAIINGLDKCETTVGDIVSMSDRELLQITNFGKKSLKELRIVIEAYALRHGVCIAELRDVQDVQGRLYSALVNGLEILGEKKMVEELMKAIKSAKETVEIKNNLKDIIYTISPSETPFTSAIPDKNFNQYEWTTTL